MVVYFQQNGTMFSVFMEVLCIYIRTVTVYTLHCPVGGFFLATAEYC